MADKSVPLRPNPTDQPVVHRQAAIRYAPNVNVKCEIVAMVKEDFGPAKVLDISSTGVSVLLQKQYEPGTLMAIEISNSDGSHKRLQIVKIVHVKELGIGNYVTGGSFTVPLTGEDIQAFLM